jgi:hypothetical protein
MKFGMEVDRKPICKLSLIYMPPITYMKIVRFIEVIPSKLLLD